MTNGEIILTVILVFIIAVIIGIGLGCKIQESEDKETIEKLENESKTISEIIRLLNYRNERNYKTKCEHIAKCKKYEKALFTLLNGANATVNTFQSYENFTVSNELELEEYKFIVEVAQEVGVWK